jgi:mono/diheme cytochrome c family protein
MVSTAALAAVAAAQVKIEKASAKPTNPTSGKEMFQTYCAVCHGNDAKGTGPAAAALRKAPADLTRLSARNGGTFPEMQVAQYIEGQEIVAAHGSRDMPIWGDVFRSMSRDAGTDHLRVVNLTNYLKTIQAQ